MSEYVSPKIASHLRNLARDVAYTEGHASVMRAAADRIESLEAERVAAFNEAQRQHEWGMDERAARAVAEARLARVIDDSMAEQIARAIAPDAWWQETAEYPTKTRDEWEAEQDWARGHAADVLATIRAVAADAPPNDLPTQEVAADEQEAGR